MNSTVEKLLKVWNEKLEGQEKHYTHADDEYKSLKREQYKNCKDNFKWLRVKTKYEALEKKLKTLIVQKLNDVTQFF